VTALTATHSGSLGIGPEEPSRPPAGGTEKRIPVTLRTEDANIGGRRSVNRGTKRGKGRGLHLRLEGSTRSGCVKDVPVVTNQADAG